MVARTMIAASRIARLAGVEQLLDASGNVPFKLLLGSSPVYTHCLDMRLGRFDITRPWYAQRWGRREPASTGFTYATCRYMGQTIVSSSAPSVLLGRRMQSNGEKVSSPRQAPGGQWTPLEKSD